MLLTDRYFLNSLQITEDMNEQTLLQSVSILESRLQFFSTEEKEGASFDRESIERVFPASAKCLYYSLLGNNYLDLYELHTNIIQKEEVESSNEEVKGILKKSLKEEKRKSNHYGMKCLEILETGMKLVSDTFDPHESKPFLHQIPSIYFPFSS